MIPSNSSGSGLGQAHTSAGRGTHRSLNEDVLQSAEDAVASEGADDYASLSRGDYVARTSGTERPYTGTLSGTGMDSSSMEDAGSGFFSRMQHRATHYVAQQPAKAAMLAAGAGALLAILMGRRGKGRRWTRGS